MRVIVLEAAGPAFSAGPRPERDDRPRRCLLPAPLRRLHRADGDDPPPPAAGDRQGARHRHGRRLPARRRLRPRRRRRQRALRHARRQDRPVLLDADGPALARDRPQARARDAAHRPADRRRHGARLGPGQPRRAGRGRLDDAVAALVEAIARSSPLTVGIGKEAFYAQIELDEHRAYDLTKAVMAMNARADDAQEGMCAFLEKRPPEWRGR